MVNYLLGIASGILLTLIFFIAGFICEEYTWQRKNIRQTRIKSLTTALKRAFK